MNSSSEDDPSIKGPLVAASTIYTLSGPTPNKWILIINTAETISKYMWSRYHKPLVFPTESISSSSALSSGIRHKKDESLSFVPVGLAAIEL
jgi:hypothetical protein